MRRLVVLLLLVLSTLLLGERSTIVNGEEDHEEDEEMVYVDDDSNEQFGSLAPKRNIHQLWNIGKVERLQWSPDKPFAREARIFLLPIKHA